MFDERLRRVKDDWGGPLLDRFERVSPLAVTLVAFGFGLAAVAFAAAGATLWALGFFTLNRLLDAFDGLLARRHHRQSDLGGYLDIVLDFAIYAALPIALVLGAPTERRYVALAVMLGAFYVNGAAWMYLAAIMEKRRPVGVATGAPARALTTVAMPAGLIGAVETFIVYCAFLLWPEAMEWIFIGFTAMVLFTTAQRLHWAVRALRP